MPYPQIVVSAALVDPKQQLVFVNSVRQGVQSHHLCLAALQPAQRARAGLLCVVVSGRVFHALVKSHGDRRCQMGLDLHALLRTHKDLLAVYMGMEGDALFFDLVQLSQTEYLEPAAVC